MDEINNFYISLSVTILLGFTVFILMLWHSIRKQAYWRERDIPYVRPLPFVGTILENFIKPQHELDRKRYSEFGAIWGTFEGNQPVISIADPELIRNILVKDFYNFINHRTLISDDSFLDSMVANLEGNDWKRVRTIITPTFSTGKLKRMLGIFKDCSQTLVQNLNMAYEKKEFINLKKVYACMSMDIIANASFSTKLDSHNDPENKFVRMAHKAFGNTTWRFAMFFLFPGLMKFFKIPVFNSDAMNFFKEIAEQIIDERNKLGKRGNDFLQLLLDTEKETVQKQKLEVVENDSDLASNYGQEIMSQKLYLNSVTKNLSTEEIVAQCVIFFLAGSETASITLSFLTYSLALNPDVQEKARQEIRNCLHETNGELTYEAIQNMKYLDNIISETLRLYPPASGLERKTEADYKLGDTGLTLTKGMIINIPISAIHKDSKYYKNPEKFDPDRFLPEERAKRHPYVYMPFGAGPRNCIGMRFALLEIKVCLVKVISHFNIKTCPQTLIPLKYNTGIFLQSHDMFLEMEPRKDCPTIK